ncbi:RsmB/NOP family class I SAM-dependent RNA methyltransferase [Cryptosporangium aurantiacum]|uniref:16S rRNA (Cytosine967-C5)-methyltransferase n=1 Tax=Cryptosporangium aurantiacum TaxID=134849 RepID=A0A1M7RFH2_9ACTN|nr:transcription antitermination factor NusB [Cryptosporangium aurantiacum]SHN44990.1 16S rRNA (cytosine967-C5)-methyltransferase [Cryptosporangium aurantiacum]
MTEGDGRPQGRRPGSGRPPAGGRPDRGRSDGGRSDGGRSDGGRGEGRPERGRPGQDRARGGSDRGRPGRDQGAGRPGRDRSERPRNESGHEGTKRSWGTYQKATPDPARRAAFDVLVAVAAREAYANLMLPSVLVERRITGRDAAFVTELTYGTLRHRGTLDAILGAGSSRPIDKVDLRVLQALRLGAYQLLFTRVPPHAAVAGTVEVARVALTDGPARFVNAVLRRVSERDLDAWLPEVTPDLAADPIAHLAIRYSHPEWVIRAFADALGEDTARLAAGDSETAAALAADNERPGVDLAARPGRIDPKELAADVSGEPGRWSPVGVKLPEGAPGDVAAIADGRAHVQDEGSQLCAWTLATAPLEGTDARWLDLCAGPGGKAGLLASIADGRSAHLTAVEVSEHRAKLVEQAVRGLPATVLTADGRDVGTHPDLPEGGFDRVLVDAPCTGLGALRRRPEARWRRQPSDVPALAKLQRELLTAALRATRPGGLVAYVTCSPHLAETRVLVADVCRRTGAEPVDVRGVPEAAAAADVNPTPEGVQLSAARAAALQLWPHRHGTDAMFLSLLRKPVTPRD